MRELVGKKKHAFLSILHLRPRTSSYLFILQQKTVFLEFNIYINEQYINIGISNISGYVGLL